MRILVVDDDPLAGEMTAAILEAVGHDPVVAEDAVGRRMAGDTALDTLSQHTATMMGDAPSCPKCGSVTVRNGACYKCLNCGTSLGCS